jgi:hypothetical protein
MKKILFCDFNGVISYNNFWSKYKDKTDSIKAIFATDLVTQWMKGDKSSEEINQIFAKTSNLNYETVFNDFVEDCKNLDVSVLVLNAIKSKKDYIKILATNNMDCFDRWFLPNNPIITDTFDFIHNSYNIKMLKEEQYFSLIPKVFGATKCIHIDDSPTICQIAKGYGIQVFCVTGETEVLEALNQI